MALFAISVAIALLFFADIIVINPPTEKSERVAQNPGPPLPDQIIAPQSQSNPVNGTLASDHGKSEPAKPPEPLTETNVAQPKIGLPIAGLKAADIKDTFNESRGKGARHHEATDILAPRGTRVVAVDDGQVRKLFTSKQGGLTVYQFDNSATYSYYYAHLDSYAPNLVEDMQLKKGDLIGYVGTTGNAAPDVPHLHFAIFVLGPQKKWWEGTPINPYPLLMNSLMDSLETP